MTSPTKEDKANIVGAEDSTAERQAKGQAAIRLLHEWLADESGYDEENWPKLKKAIEETHDSSRDLFR